MAKIVFSCGKVYESEAPVSVYEAARALELTSREVIAAKVGGEVTELSTVVEGEAEVQLLTYRDKEGKVYKYAMNGYTGKVYGELPISKYKLAGTFAAIMAAVAAVVFAVGWLLL